MIEEKPDSQDDASEMSDAIIDAVKEDRADSEDALSKRERKVEMSKEEERIQKAKELKKQLRKRELGILRYRWPAAILIISGVFSIVSEFLDVWNNTQLFYGFNTYWEAFLFSPNVFWLFPLICGCILILIGFFAYARPKFTFLAVIPAMMMTMAGALPYFLIDLVGIANPDAIGDIQATLVPIQMFIVAVLCLLAIAMREKE